MRFKYLGVAALTAGLALGAAACGSSGSSAASPATPKATTPAAASPAASTSGSAMTPFGSGCAAVPASGKGSFTGMSAAPVASAASNNPLLSTLVTAVKTAGLVDTLNSAPAITVFAPDNSAFAKIPKATLDTLLANKAELTKVLTYHVVSGRLTPADFTSGKSVKTLEGGAVTLSKMGATYEVNSSQVVCGDVQTANANVYIIGTTLTPPSS
jgi:uncharacterized surface protein with fasciclin (FAS1) repeats